MEQIYLKFPTMPRSFLWDIGLSSVLETRNKWYDDWHRTTERMMVNFEESALWVLRGTSPLSRGSMKSKGRRKVSMHFNAEPHTAERAMLAVYQLRRNGAVAHWCNDHYVSSNSTTNSRGNSSTCSSRTCIRLSTKQKNFGSIGASRLGAERC